MRLAVAIAEMSARMLEDLIHVHIVVLMPENKNMVEWDLQIDAQNLSAALPIAAPTARRL
jgi:hypothetical protein